MLAKTLAREWQYIFSCLFVVFLPYGGEIWPLIILGLIFWFRSKPHFNFRGLSLVSWIFILFFIFYVLGMVHASDKRYSFEVLKNNLGFIIVPILFYNNSITRKQLNSILRIFCISNIAVSIYLIARAVIISVYWGEPIYNYSKYSVFWHPTYFSFFFVFSIAILHLVGFTFFSKPKYDSILKAVFSGILTTSVMLCCSKMGYISLLSTYLIVFIHFAIKHFSIPKILVSMLVTTLVLIVFSNTILKANNRFNNMTLDYHLTKGLNYWDIKQFNIETAKQGLNQKESTLARIFIWSSAWPAIKQHILLGVGTGDVSKAMSDSAENYGIKFLKKYNMHNQFLETQLGMGIGGTLILLFLTIGSLIYAIKRRDVVFSIFALLAILNFSVESMLISHLFPLFFSLLLFLFFHANKNLEEINSD